jgi:hypothetical protein
MTEPWPNFSFPRTSLVPTLLTSHYSQIPLPCPQYPSSCTHSCLEPLLLTSPHPIQLILPTDLPPSFAQEISTCAAPTDRPTAVGVLCSSPSPVTRPALTTPTPVFSSDMPFRSSSTNPVDNMFSPGPRGNRALGCSRLVPPPLKPVVPNCRTVVTRGHVSDVVPRRRDALIPGRRAISQSGPPAIFPNTVDRVCGRCPPRAEIVAYCA